MSAAALVGDIGGTNTRLALAVDGTYRGVARYRNAEVADLESCLADYLDREALDAGALELVLAVAGPVDGDTVELTNLDWTLSGARLGRRFRFRAVRFLNDFAALAWAVPCLGPAERVALGGGEAVAGAPALILGPGTGFGASLWLPPDRAIATEGGHALLAGVSEAEIALLARLRERLGPVSYEQVLSGPGLVNLYRALGGEIDAASDAAAVAARAEAGDAVAGEAFAHFFAFLGLAARNLALATGARGGVYLAGGILPRYPERLAASRFRERFETPAPLGDYLPRLPTWLVTHPEAALLGLAAWCDGPR
ncbi:MAG: glucokinase [Gammaproteobacteria bacterium]|nr:glucokinase [Gammaproteobacteria bacterium]MCP5200154.1 glucokinase [Gammaproteobacteria bacterium]